MRFFVLFFIPYDYVFPSSNEKKKYSRITAILPTTILAIMYPAEIPPIIPKNDERKRE